MFSPAPSLVRLSALLAAGWVTLAAAATAAGAGALSIQFRAGADRLAMETRDARQQLLVSDAAGRDLTRTVTWSSQPPGVVAVDATGRVTPLADGETVLTARAADGSSATLPATVRRSGEAAPIHFANQIVPIFTKNGCNGGGCHGKAAGQNGFRLSLLGFEPAEDYEHLLREARGRRLFPAAPERSLLLTKGTAELPHGGGKRLDRASDDYRRLTRWIAQGMP
ncbi:MAG: Ig domain-containing protein, partial [Verrucomicrobiota bacterium]